MGSTTRTPAQFTAHQFFYGAERGCWNLQHRWDELRQRAWSFQSDAHQFYVIDDVLHDTLVRLGQMYGTSLLPGPSPHLYGTFVNARTGQVEPILDDPLDFFLRIAFDRRRTLHRKRWRELSRHASVAPEEQPSTHEGDSVEQEELRRAIDEFHETACGRQCRELHRLHYDGHLTYDAIVERHGRQLNVTNVATLRARASRCREHLQKFIRAKYPGLTGYWVAVGSGTRGRTHS